jgi:hypothetical protein
MNAYSYFESEKAQNRALEACRNLLGGRDWAVRDRLRLYDLSRDAFGSPGSLASFRMIYEELVRPAPAGGWGIGRNASGPMWTAERAFETLKGLSQFAWGGGVTLLNFKGSGAEASLLSMLESMRTLKPVKDWPVMAVSKVLHFYNGELFPIYDNEVIWKKVLNRFREEFRQFCRSYSPPYDIGETPIFYRNYLNWGNELLNYAYPGLMANFVRWLGKQTGADLPRRSFDPGRLYATAFEYMIIGAYADSTPGQRSIAGITQSCRAS